jgi:hypothetical protein
VIRGAAKKIILRSKMTIPKEAIKIVGIGKETLIKETGIIRTKVPAMIGPIKTAIAEETIASGTIIDGTSGTAGMITEII